MNPTTISTASWKTSNHQNHQAAVKSLGASGPTRSQCPSAQGLVAILCFCIMGRRCLSTDQASSALWKQKRSHAWSSSLSLAGAATVRLQDPSCCARCNFITTPGAAPLHQCEADWYHIKMKDPKHALLPGVFVKRIFKTCQTQVKFFNVNFLGDLRRNLTEI